MNVRMQRGWILEFMNQLRQQHPAGLTSESLENLLREKIIQTTIEDIRPRLGLLQWGTYLLAAALFFKPFLLVYVAG
jgi:hypothetical protein